MVFGAEFVSVNLILIIYGVVLACEDSGAKANLVAKESNAVNIAVSPKLTVIVHLSLSKSEIEGSV